MDTTSNNRPAKGERKARVPFRRNRSAPPRDTDWTRRARDAEDHELDTKRRENVVAKGELSRRRTIIVNEDGTEALETLPIGIVVAMRGLYADVDDGAHIRSCTVRRVLRTRLIEERHPVTVGDRVRFRVEPDVEGVTREGVIEAVEPRRGELRRRAGKRIQTIAANVDQAIIVASADEPPPKPHLIDRYLVAAHAGNITPVVCMNKVDLDDGQVAQEMLDRYTCLGYRTLRTSATTGQGIDTLRELLKDNASVLAGQSGVGKSSLLNAVQPGLRLEAGDVIEHLGKGRHTTSTAGLIRLDCGGYVVDTPGVRSFDLSVVPRHELEAYFVEFVQHVPHCKYPDCTHRHEDDCAVKRAVHSGAIHQERYQSYVRLFEDPGTHERHR